MGGGFNLLDLQSGDDIAPPLPLPIHDEVAANPLYGQGLLNLPFKGRFVFS